MPESTRVMPSRPRISAENLQKHEVGDYTFTPELAREWLGLTQAGLDELVERSQLNASRGLFGPLVLVNGGPSFTMASVFFCRRLLAVTAH
jgi:hypothetical protein